MSPSRSARPVHRRAPAALAALATTLALAVAPVPAASAEQGSPPGSTRAAAPARTTTVMTRNLYLGSGLTDVVGALAGGDPNQIVAAATRTWSTVQASQPEARMAAVADEIVAAGPDVVGLQEVTRWSTYAYDPQTQSVVGGPTVAYDFLSSLLEALADRGVSYRVVPGATADNFASDPIPVLTGGAFPTTAVQLQDRDVILARAGVRTEQARSGSYSTILGPPASPIAIERGWGSVEVRTRLARYRFVNTHLEAFEDPALEAIRVAQVQELFAVQDAVAAQRGALPMVYVGDFNTVAPSAPAYLVLRSRLDDAWLGAGSGPGLTCCTPLTAAVLALETRIDLVLHSSHITATSAEVVGDEPVALPGGVRWASDHLGVVAELVVGAASRPGGRP